MTLLWKIENDMTINDITIKKGTIFPCLLIEKQHKCNSHWMIMEIIPLNTRDVDTVLLKQSLGEYYGIIVDVIIIINNELYDLGGIKREDFGKSCIKIDLNSINSINNGDN